MTLPPLRTIPRLVEPLWGGQRLAAWLDLAPPRPERLGESWLVYDENVVVGGPYAGQRLGQLAATYGAALVGTRTVARYGADFPLLAKFIDAAERLSIQVHPDDDYAHNLEAHTGFHGKTEAWYILDALPGAHITYGLVRACSRAEFLAAVANGSVEQLMAHVPVQAGDVIFVPAGVLHAINAGIMLFEIQQKSDLTYRVYDYGRRDRRTGQLRELHLEQALAVSRLSPGPQAKVAPVALGPGRDLLVRCPYFALERWTAGAPTELTTDAGSFEIWTLLAGYAELHWADQTFPLGRGDAVVLPASLGRYRLPLGPEAVMLRAFVPG
ncbi:type I phosphomannose isomerase catalytic subunit [Candidatus Viridilinea mediisalina]|uniref:Phosphohexomutase n=1 Tax=Candidatus Viridilinea mediisalina TaxID=2024553 RepID=A0A2A6RDR8_9CHLR|nr:type I phosphomannose isomerase catalytic subunit [Candidatus Viridilinea mediisalina]PDW00001.1 mannose-6-phosphate isomerase [Candidatus Viridilinea mediisalina]